MSKYDISYVAQKTRIYRDKTGKVVACATSPDNFDVFINYFCLPEIWEEDENTTWVSEEDLNSWMIGWKVIYFFDT